jgi:hypothetical protein
VLISSVVGGKVGLAVLVNVKQDWLLKLISSNAISLRKLEPLVAMKRI